VNSYFSFQSGLAASECEIRINRLLRDSFIQEDNNSTYPAWSLRRLDRNPFTFTMELQVRPIDGGASINAYFKRKGSAQTWILGWTLTSALFLFLFLFELMNLIDKMGNVTIKELLIVGGLFAMELLMAVGTTVSAIARSNYEKEDIIKMLKKSVNR
jgi:hypothetical protein